MSDPLRTALVGRGRAALLAAVLTAGACVAAAGEATEAAFAPAAGSDAAGDGTAGGGEPARGLRSALEVRGVAFEGVLWLDHSTLLTGGVRRGSAFRYPLGLSIDVETQRLFGWAGGRLHVGAYAHHGASGGDLVGDAQGFDNLDATPFRGLLEAWGEQAVAGGRLRVKAGRVDANSEFATVERAAPFLHSSAGFSPAIHGFPSFPGPAPSVNVLADPRPWLHAGVGVYRVGPAAGDGPARRVPFVVTEASGRWRIAGRGGRLSLGRWSHLGGVEPDSGGTLRAHGLYAVLEHEMRPGARPDRPGISVFLQAGRASGHAGDVDQHVGGGLVWPGALPGRPEDIVGILLSAVRFDAAGPSALRPGGETAVELVYDARLLERLSVRADLQRISNPGGQGRRPALVGSLRAEVRF